MGTTCFNLKLPSQSRDVPPPEDVRALFVGGAPDIDETELRRYLVAFHGEGHDDANVDHLLEQIRLLDRSTGPRQRFTLYGFHRFLFSHDLNPPILHQHVHHDMTLPLSHYFIYTGHNPYNDARPDRRRRRSGRCGDDDPIIRALKTGVRAIEVSMWPNSKLDNIEILHCGRTLKNPVSLTECLKSIKEYAFVASPYPVILTLEDNLPTPNLQEKAAEVVHHVLGDILYWPDTDRIDISHYHLDAGRVVVLGSTDYLKDFPSPEELKGRVLLSKIIKKEKPNPTEVFLSPEELKGRVLLSKIIKKEKPNPTEVGSKVDGTLEQGEVQKGAEEDDVAWGSGVPDFQTEIQSAIKHYDDSGDGNEEEQKMQQHEYAYQHLIITNRPGKQKGRSMQSAPMLLRGARPGPIIAYPFADEDLQSESDKVRCLILSKQQIIERAAHFGIGIVRFTKRNILWIYPRGTVTSSNYNPFLGWVYGAQMVALNMQEYGRALWLMHGFYRANGGCGYVRKPYFLMQTCPHDFDPREHRPVKKTLKVKVYMGDGWRMDFKHTRKFIPDLWASVGIAGVSKDSSLMMNTKATEGTWVPVWGDEFNFPLTVPEIALLRVEVHQYDLSKRDIFGGQTVLPVSELRPGIRAVALCDRQGNKLKNVKLLMRFEFV